MTKPLEVKGSGDGSTVLFDKKLDQCGVAVTISVETVTSPLFDDPNPTLQRAKISFGNEGNRVVIASTGTKAWFQKKSEGTWIEIEDAADKMPFNDYQRLNNLAVFTQGALSNQVWTDYLSGTKNQDELFGNLQRECNNYSE